MKPFKTLLFAGIAFMALSAPVYAEEGHDHGAEAGHANEATEAHAMVTDMMRNHISRLQNLKRWKRHGR